MHGDYSSASPWSASFPRYPDKHDQARDAQQTDDATPLRALGLESESSKHMVLAILRPEVIASTDHRPHACNDEIGGECREDIHDSPRSAADDVFLRLFDNALFETPMRVDGQCP